MRSIMIVFLAAPLCAGPLRPMSSAETCGQCHRAILEAWKGSAHARAMESPVFQDALDAAETVLGPGVRRTCMGCHAPLAVEGGDLQLDRKASWEGVTCDYCHSIREVSFDGGVPRPKLEFGAVKSGPVKHAVSGAHATAYSPVHESSRVCAPCHEYRNQRGFPVLSTFSEWQASRFAKEGKNCQSCHMYQVAGNVADVRVVRASDARINLHRMPGGRSVQQLNQTIKAELALTREGGKVRAVVGLANVAAGHYVPTGSPLRQLILEIQASNGAAVVFRDKRIYARSVVGSNGVALTREHDSFLDSVKTLSDTRLAPDESRKEQFQFDLPPGVAADVTATLSYYYSPAVRSESDRKMAFRSLRARIQ